MILEMRSSGDMEKKKCPPLKRKWYLCPICGTKLALTGKRANCNQIYIKCRTCKNEIEIKV